MQGTKFRMALNVSTPELATMFSKVPVNRQTSAIAALQLQDMAKDNLVKAQGARNLRFAGDSFEFQAKANTLNDTANLFGTLAVRPQLFARMAGNDGFLSFQELNTAASVDGQEGLSSFDLQALSPQTYSPNQQVTRSQLETIAYGGPLGGYSGGYGNGFSGGYGATPYANSGFANQFLNPYQASSQALGQAQNGFGGYNNVPALPTNLPIPQFAPQSMGQQGLTPQYAKQMTPQYAPQFSGSINPYQNFAQPITSPQGPAQGFTMPPGFPQFA
jgi:hypothetical protein